MHIAIRSHGFTLTESIRDYAERRLRFALSHVASRVIGVTIVLSDINGPRGGRDKCCRIRVKTRELPVIVIDHVEDSMHFAIDRAMDRAGRTASRKLSRVQLSPKLSGRRDSGRSESGIPFLTKSQSAGGSA